MTDLINIILEWFRVQKEIALIDLVDLINESLPGTTYNKVKNAIKLMKNEYVIIDTGKGDKRLYNFVGIRELLIAEKTKIITKVVTIKAKSPSSVVCSPAKAKLHDCYYLVMANRLNGSIGIGYVMDFFNMPIEHEVYALMKNCAHRYKDTIAVMSPNSYEHIRLYIR